MHLSGVHVREDQVTSYNALILSMKVSQLPTGKGSEHFRHDEKEERLYVENTRNGKPQLNLLKMTTQWFHYFPSVYLKWYIGLTARWRLLQSTLLKAFDSVNRTFLLQVLNAMDFPRVFVNWTRVYDFSNVLYKYQQML